MKHLFILLLIALCMQAVAQKRVTLTIGNKVLYSADGQPYVAGTANLSRGDTLSLILSSSDPFQQSQIRFVLLRISTSQKVAVSEQLITVNPGTKYIRNRLPANNLILKYGYGNFLMQFYSGNILLAEKIYRIGNQ